MEKSIHSKDYAIFLELLKSNRENAGLSQSAVADRLNATQTFVSKCERGERRLDIVELHKWCAALGIEMPTFVTDYVGRLNST